MKQIGRQRKRKTGSSSEDEVISTTHNPMLTLHGSADSTVDGYRLANEHFLKFFGVPLKRVHP